MSKGVTPVVATVLLIFITIGAAGTLYTMVEQNIDQGKKAAQDISLKVSELRVESCYHRSGRTNMVIRNGGDKAINASKMNLLLNGSLVPKSEYSVENPIVNQGNTFTVNMTKFGRKTSIELTNGRNSLEHVCISLD
ncbi:MAG: archaellin/type IV pilin N-terminal domain-containing protein [Candidatus Nanohalobium sp.]